MATHALVATKSCMCGALVSHLTAARLVAGGLAGKPINDLQDDVDSRMIYILVTTRNNPQVPLPPNPKPYPLGPKGLVLHVAFPRSGGSVAQQAPMALPMHALLVSGVVLGDGRGSRLQTQCRGPTGCFTGCLHTAVALQWVLHLTISINFSAFHWKLSDMLFACRALCAARWSRAGAVRGLARDA